MIKDAQFRQLRQFLSEGHPLYRAAWKVDMDVKSARKYRHAERLPRIGGVSRTWRTREDPFQDVGPATLVTCWSSIPGFRPRPSFPISNAAFQAGSPTSSSVPYKARSKRGRSYPRVHPKRFSSIRSTGPASYCLGLHAHEPICGSHLLASRLITWTITLS